VSETLKHGFVSLVGRPNVGKSTLINHLIGEKVAIVSKRPQTTRSCLRGILTKPEQGQIIFVDTPGIHKPKHLLARNMMDQALHVLDEVDWHLFVVDATEAPGPGDRFIADTLAQKAPRTFLLLNKIDKLPKGEKEQFLKAYTDLGHFKRVIPISAKHSEGLEDLLTALFKELPSGPPLYPEDEYTDQSERVMAAELVREQVFRQTGSEIPHAASVYIEQFKYRTSNLVYISAIIVVERDSQKRIVIGKQGQKLKEIGEAARVTISSFLGTKVYLELFVKVMPHWRNERRRLLELGYTMEKEPGSVQ
jgi:GTPase